MSGGLPSLILGRSVLVTGVTPRPDGGARVYLGPRYRGIYVNVDGADANRIVGEWGGGDHLFTDKPPAEAFRFDAEDACYALRRLWWGDDSDEMWVTP